MKEIITFLESLPSREAWLDNTEKELKNPNPENSVYYRQFIQKYERAKEYELDNVEIIEKTIGELKKLLDLRSEG